MRWLLDYLVNFYFIYFLLHIAELSFCFQFFSFNCNLDFFYQWRQIIKWNAVLFTKKLWCGWVMMNKRLIMSGLRLVGNYSFSNWSIGTYVENYFILTFHAKHEQDYNGINITLQKLPSESKLLILIFVLALLKIFVVFP